MTTAPIEQVISAVRFLADFPTAIGRMAFSELGGINSKVASSEYIYNDHVGATVHSKQFGKTDPPTVVLRRALDRTGNNKLLAWHDAARRGLSGARADGRLTITDPSGQTKVVYFIDNAWISELSITQMKAGSSEVAMIEIKLTCDAISSGEKQ
ncbi:phage tail protein [Kribbella sp. NPDC026611]|uniref:phage tail protein n=1 Tax=Kribbella sp. NPDC026611 TaxID=3154911 RepID=UPI0033E9367E